jgi:AbrB family looped-hinge helix DNA binding protein
MPFMATHLTIDKAGRVVIPKAVREELHLESGDSLEMESAGESITLRPVRGTGPLVLVKEHGVWVFRTGQPLPASATLAHCALKARAETIYSWNARLYAQCGPDVTQRLRTL